VFKGSYGHHPLTAWCDNTDESLAVKLRPGNAGSNTAADHIAIVDAAVAQIPAKYRRKMLFTCDGAGSTHALVEHITKLGARPGFQVHYSAGSDFDERIRAVLPRLPESAWTPALDADGTPRPDAQAAELTGLLRHSTGGDRLAGWPAGMRILIRRENPHPGAQLSLFEQHEGKRYQVTATNNPPRADPVPRSPPPHPGKGRGQDPLREKHRPEAFAITGLHGQYRLVPATSIARDLLAWLRLLALDGDLAKAEPKTLRYKILHTAGRIVKGQRRRHLKIPPSWPWAQDIAGAFTQILALPPP
jgi:Transposase DDE domain group 1